MHSRKHGGTAWCMTGGCTCMHTDLDSYLVLTKKKQSMLSRQFPKFQSYAVQETSLPKRKTKTGRWLCWQSWQTRLIELIYGNNGLMTADDSICFDAKSEQIEQVSMKLSGKFLKYFQNKLKSNIKNKLNRPLTSGLVKSP